MGKQMNVGVGNVARKGKVPNIGINQVARNGKAGWVGVGGVARQFFADGIPLQQLANGDTVYVYENGKPVPFYISHKNYEKELNGAGRVLLVRKNKLTETVKFSSGYNKYSGSTLDYFMDETYYNTIDPGNRQLIEPTIIYYVPGNGDFTIKTMTRNVFALSLMEWGVSRVSTSAVVKFGTPLKYIPPLHYSVKPPYEWTRNPYDDDFGDSAHKLACVINSDWEDNWGNNRCNVMHYARPAFTVKNTCVVDENMILQS